MPTFQTSDTGTIRVELEHSRRLNRGSRSGGQGLVRTVRRRYRTREVASSRCRLARRSAFLVFVRLTLLTP
jgi:hypothetical protein